MKKYSFISADPPWPYNTWNNPLGGCLTNVNAVEAWQKRCIKLA